MQVAAAAEAACSVFFPNRLSRRRSTEIAFLLQLFLFPGHVLHRAKVSFLSLLLHHFYMIFHIKNSVHSQNCQSVVVVVDALPAFPVHYIVVALAY